MNRFALAAQYSGFSLAAAAEWDAPAAALFGPSGSGKSSVLEAIAGLRPEVRGPVQLLDRSLEKLAPRQRGLGWVPQDAALFPHLSAWENIRFAARLRGGEQAARHAVEILEIESLLARPAALLSGGERQRVAIARALAARPSFLLLDEPLASIDRPLRARIVPFLQRIPREFELPMLLVTHDPLEVLALARHVMVLAEGRVVQSGDPREIFPAPAAYGSLHGLTAENVFAVAEILEAAPGVLVLRTQGGCVLTMAIGPGQAAPRRVAVAGEDVLVAIRRPEGISAQNILEASVESIESAGALRLLRCWSGGERWVAKLTRRAVEQLALAPGAAVHLVIKAHSLLDGG